MDNHSTLLDGFGFTEMIGIQAEGQAGGMVVLWNHNIVTIHNFVRRSQEISATIDYREKHKHVPLTSSVHIQWRKPGKRLFKLIVDGAFIHNIMQCGLRGALRNAKGDWIMGFKRRAYGVTQLHAELLALQEGLRITIENNHNPLEIEIDSTEVVNAPNEGEENLA
ncbi:PREDICTED: uncharacterized protein LOC109214792 [Nicotiana attenuata]|uniref:uncharacterized protein LOC109214792 n=1 Tax=Nicotiana attenuata TaxID=49451 RepID=UPI0009052B31|nr:PREDICTED: uncharacterized protein LOC109214792 [Nicotiana attenuata]